MSKLQIPEWEKREKTIYVECEEVDDRTAISPIKAAACEVACGMHLLAFWFGSAASIIGGLDEE